jgi:hypothetical protein
MHGLNVAVSVALGLLVGIGGARADTIVALAPAADARKAVAIGPSGEVYEPDGKGTWTRYRAGGVAEEIVAAAAASGGTVIAGAKDAPLFKLVKGVWTTVHLELKAAVLLGAGSRPVAAVGKSVYALDGQRPAKLGDAAEPIVALAGGAGRIVVATSTGLHALEGKAFKPLAKARQVKGLVSERWALVDRGAFDLKSMKTIAWPPGFVVGEATAIGGELLAVASQGAKAELFTVKAGKLARETIPFDTAAEIAGIVADKAGHVVVAARDGRIAMRDGGTWTTTEVRVELAHPRPGAPPATSKQ